MYMNFAIFSQFFAPFNPYLTYFLIPPTFLYIFLPSPPQKSWFFIKLWTFFIPGKFLPTQILSKSKNVQNSPFLHPITPGTIKRRRSQLIISFGGVLTFWGPLGPELWTFQTFFNSSTDINNNSTSHDDNISNSGGFGTYLAGVLPPPRPPAFITL